MRPHLRIEWSWQVVIFIMVIEVIGEVLDQGSLEIVIKAMALGIRSFESETTVVVKRSKPQADIAHYKKLMMELKIISHLGKHLNVVNFLGACSEYMAHGEFLDFY